MNDTDLGGKRLGGYEIQRRLGQGGMAVVYRAHEASLNRVVALKVIAQQLSEQPEFIERFKREAQAAAQLNHPNIVQIYAIGEAEGVHYFAMEYVNGRTLREVIEEEGFLTAGRAVPIVSQVAEALSVAHQADIVHRDIKPANIMLDGAGRVKVTDFGIAQRPAETRLTKSGMLVGTLEYVSPEQCKGEALDGRSDIYSLGVTFYQMLSGRTPFEADTPGALVLKIVEGNVTTVGELNPTVPAQVQEIVAKMMHIDRSKRFQKAEDVVDALASVKAEPSTTKKMNVQRAEPARSTAPVARDPQRRRSPVMALAASVALMLALGLFAWWAFFPNAGASPDPTTKEPPAEQVREAATAAVEDDPAAGTDPAAVRPAADSSTDRPPAQQPPETELVYLPPVNSVVAATSGEYEYVDLVNTWVESVLSDYGFAVIDYPSSPYGSVQEAARFHVVTTARLISSRQLEYFGRVETQYTVGLTMRATDLADGVSVAGPLDETVQYTAVNLQQNLERGTKELVRRLAQELRHIIERG